MVLSMEERTLQNKLSQLFGMQDWGQLGEINLFSTGPGCYQENMPAEEFLSKYQQEQEVQSNPDYGSLVDLHFDNVSLPFQLCQEEIAKLESILSEC